MSRRESLGEILWPDDDVSRKLAAEWAELIVEEALDLVWRGFDDLSANELKDHPNLVEMDPEQLERELSQYHSLALTKIWARTTNGFGSFTPIHEQHEFESRKGGKAAPPSNDIGFVHSENKRWKLPVEAKLLHSDRALGEYLNDVTVKYESGAAAPLVGECGMIGYLLQGTTDKVFNGLATRLNQTPLVLERFADRAHRTTAHHRTTAPELRMHHMVMSCVPVATTSGDASNRH